MFDSSHAGEGGKGCVVATSEKGIDMLSVTPTAAEAVEKLASQSDAPESAGVRIARAGEEADPAGELRLSVVDAPAAGDQHVPDAQVYLEPEVAPLLEDKVLDADVSGEQIRFSVHD
jgi:Fe-S cluster assembly iron-binding protein IscA